MMAIGISSTGQLFKIDRHADDLIAARMKRLKGNDEIEIIGSPIAGRSEPIFKNGLTGSTLDWNELGLVR